MRIVGYWPCVTDRVSRDLITEKQDEEKKKRTNKRVDDGVEYNQRFLKKKKLTVATIDYAPKQKP